VCTSLRRNPPKPTTQENGKAINIEPEEEEIEDSSMDDEDVGVDMEEVEAQGADPITRLPNYTHSCKGKTKVPNDIDERKVPLQTPLLLDEIVFEGPHSG